MRFPPLVGAIVMGWLLIANSACANPYQAGENFNGFSAVDQHGQSVAFKAGSAKFVIFDTPGESGSSVQPKDPNWFEDQRALLVVNLSELSTFKCKIARSRLADKPFRALLVEDASVAGKFPQKEKKLTVLSLDDSGKIIAIQFAAPGKELQDLVTATRKE